jgi:TetR/AcrR family transcriptional regulator, regulator of autoinduction and epiphytic fitness
MPVPVKPGDVKHGETKRSDAKRGDMKRAAVIAAATAAFLAHGYEAASMDAIAADACVSKRTVYNHFPSKRELFRAVTQQLYAGLIEADALSGAADEPPEIALPRLARAILQHLRQPEVCGLLRLVVAEARRIPELAAEFQNVGKGPAVGIVERYFAAQQGRGRLDVADPLLAAQQFLGAVKESLFWPALIGVPTRTDEDEVIAAATRMVLRVYAIDAAS